MNRQNTAFIFGMALLVAGSVGIIQNPSFLVLIPSIACAYYGAKKIIKATD